MTKFITFEENTMKPSTLKLLILSSLVLVSLNTMGLSSSFNDAENEQKGDRRGPPPFNKLDIDGDGLITLEEFKQHKLPRGEHDVVFKHIDANRNGVISEQELTSHKPPKESNYQKRYK